MARAVRGPGQRRRPGQGGWQAGGARRQVREGRLRVGCGQWDGGHHLARLSVCVFRSSQRAFSPFGEFVDVFCDLICAAQECVRRLCGGERSSTSLRDVSRCGEEADRAQHRPFLARLLQLGLTCLCLLARGPCRLCLLLPCVQSRSSAGSASTWRACTGRPRAGRCRTSSASAPRYEGQADAHQPTHAYPPAQLSCSKFMVLLGVSDHTLLWRIDGCDRHTRRSVVR